MACADKHDRLYTNSSRNVFADSGDKEYSRALHKGKDMVYRGTVSDSVIIYLFVRVMFHLLKMRLQS